jgi:hypothetical protein
MSTDSAPDSRRDDVLFAFHQACEHPTADQIVEWATRYPEFADDIRAHAAVALDWAARKDMPAAVPDAGMLARGHSRVLDALFNAEVAANAAAEPAPSFHQLMAERGTDVPRLARALGIARSVLADLVNGGILAPVGRRLVNALTAALDITADAFDRALQHALGAPRLGHAKADGAPTIRPRPYEDVIRTSNMTTERINYWLSDA